MNDAPRPEHSPSPTPREHSIERLLALLENATEGSRELDMDIMEAIGLPTHFFGSKVERWWRAGRGGWDCVTADGYSHIGAQREPQFSRSLDAALTLVPEGYDWDVGHIHENSCVTAYVMWPATPAMWAMETGKSSTPAIALCIAALKARSAP